MNRRLSKNNQWSKLVNRLDAKISGFFKRGSAHADYPRTEIFDGPLASTSRSSEVDGEPLTHHVSVYHSGRSDEPTTFKEQPVVETGESIGCQNFRILQARFSACRLSENRNL